METPVGFDVFLSHNSKDNYVVRLLAEKLKSQGLSVWLDEEQLSQVELGGKRLKRP